MSRFLTTDQQTIIYLIDIIRIALRLFSLIKDIKKIKNPNTLIYVLIKHAHIILRFIDF